MENLCRVFFPNDKIEVIKQYSDNLQAPYVLTEISEGLLTAQVKIGDFEKKLSLDNCKDSDIELELAHMVYKLLCEYTGIKPPWGILTGVRPIKLFRRISQDSTVHEAERYFKESLYVDDSRLELCKLTERNEKKIIDLSQKNSFSLYISIPFCPTRCAYCSFVSQSIAQAKRLVEPYVQLLLKEIRETAAVAKQCALKLESVYIGGGTPTTLSDTQLASIIEEINSSFDMSSCREFTVEAGRPDTITPEKLRAIKNGGADRISINPQTLNDEVLRSIGRRHTSEQILNAFEMARNAGFENINADLIAGLPGESFESFVFSLGGIIALSPEDITVHTLSMKKSSYLTADGLKLYKKDADTCRDMVDYSIKTLENSGYIPYYLYRQSRMVGNLENTGWSKPGKECLYNVFIMDETHTVLACGAGGVTKLRAYGQNYIERIFNFKYPYEYIGRFDEMIRRKERIGQFYEQYHG